MEIADSDSHRYADAYPCRLPVWWARTGEPGPHTEQEGVTGMLITLRIEKRFNRFERILAKVMRAPREVRRPLDRMNSMLWELCDGSRSFQEVCSAMDATFNEDIAPPVDRTASGIDALKSRNLMTFLSEPFTGKWSISPGKTPIHQTLVEVDERRGYDIEPRSESERNGITADGLDVPQDDQSQ